MSPEAHTGERKTLTIPVENQPGLVTVSRSPIYSQATLVVLFLIFLVILKMTLTHCPSSQLNQAPACTADIRAGFSQRVESRGRVCGGMGECEEQLGSHVLRKITGAPTGSYSQTGRSSDKDRRLQKGVGTARSQGWAGGWHSGSYSLEGRDHDEVPSIQREASMVKVPTCAQVRTLTRSK